MDILHKKEDEEKVLQVTPEFKKLIRELLKRGKIKNKTLDLFTNQENIKTFRTAFIHQSFSDDYNYEHLEFLGDTTVNDCVANWLHETFPEIVNVDWLTRMKHALISKKTLGLLARDAGFFKHIKYGEDIQESLNSTPELEENKDYKNMLEDTFEAFIGALVKVSNKETRRGVGHVLAYNIIKSFLDELRSKGGISLNYKDYYDPISRLKEIYDKYYWDFRNSQSYNSLTQEAIFWGYPKFNKRRLNDEGEIIERNKAILGRAVGKDKEQAIKKAASQALETLSEKYKVEGVIPNPYNRNKYKKKRIQKY